MFEFLTSYHSFSLNGQSNLGHTGLLWLNLGSNILLTLGCFIVAAFLFKISYQQVESSQRLLGSLLGTLILLMGALLVFTQLTENPSFRALEVTLRFLAIIVSVATALAFWKIWPTALKAIDFSGFRDARHKSSELRDNLERQVEEKTEKLIQADKAKDQFLAMVSHELRSPLAIVAGYFELLEMSDGSDPEERDFALRNIKINLIKQQVLLNNLVDVSRIISGNFPIEMQFTDLNNLINDTIDGLVLRAEQNHITIERRISSNLGSVNCDGMRIGQVITNLVENSIKFSPQGATILFSCEVDAEANVIMRVKDHGVGILPDHLPYVFEHYWQASENKHLRSIGGLGLGLAIAKHIVDGHNGKITAKSEGPGNGTEFLVVIPGRKFPELPADQGDTEEIKDERRARKDLLVLIVDDNYDVLQLLRRLTVKLGMHPTTTSTVKDAIDILSKEPFDVILSDISLPTTDGLDFIEAVRRMEKNRGIPPRVAIAISANVSERQRIMALKAGFDAFLSKPVTANQLLATISRLSRKRQIAH